VTVVARRTCRSPAEAERLRRALEADNPPYVRVHVSGSDLVAETSASSAARVRATFEDLLACLQLAERAADVGGRSTSD
jgi:hypothetical protein